MLWTASGATGETGKAGELKFLRSATLVGGQGSVWTDSLLSSWVQVYCEAVPSLVALVLHQGEQGPEKRSLDP